MTDELTSEVGPAADPGEGASEGLVRRAFRLLVRLVAAVLLGFGLGVGIYFGAPAMWRAAMEPIEANTARLDQLESELEGLRAAQDNADRSSSAQLAAMEGKAAANGERLSELESQLIELEGSLSEQERQARSVDELAGELEALADELRDLERRLDALEEAEQIPDAAVDLGRELQQLRAMELIARARFEILSDNYGLARENVALAQAGLQALMEGAAASDLEALQSVDERLDLAQRSLDENPDLAANDLELAWRLLVELTGPGESGP